MHKRCPYYKVILQLVLLCFLLSAEQLVNIAWADNEQIAIDSYQVDIGSTVDAPINVANAAGVAGGSIKIGFDKSVIVVEDVAEADFGAPITNTDNTDGFVYIAVARATAVGKTNATLAIVKFRGVSEGNSSLSVQNVELNDENGNIIVPELISQGSIMVIPEFSSVLTMIPLLLATLIVTAIYRRKLKR